MINKKITVFEVNNELQINQVNFHKELLVLDKFRGFPELLFKQSERHLGRWHTEKLERIFRDDIQNLEVIRDIGSMQLLGDMLPEKIGSQFVEILPLFI